MQKIIAFYSPYPRAGKSTAASHLFECYSFGLLRFADPIERFVAAIMGKIYSGNVFNTLENKDKPIMELNGASWRDFMIAFGQAGRSVYQNTWSDIIKALIIKNPLQNFVIDDLRFPNEYGMLKKQGAKIIRVTNPDREIIKSETEGLLEDYEFDYQLVNDKSKLIKYCEQIKEMLKYLWPEENE